MPPTPLLSTLKTIWQCPKCRRTKQDKSGRTIGPQKGGLQKGGFGGCSLDPPKRNEGTKPERQTPKTGTRVEKKERRYRKLEGGRIRQNHPFTKPPFFISGPKIGARGLEPLLGQNERIVGERQSIAQKRVRAIDARNSQLENDSNAAKTSVRALGLSTDEREHPFVRHFGAG